MPNPYSYGTITRGADLDAPTITIEGVTEDNYLLLAKANGLEPQVDAAGNITGWYYVETSSELDENGNQVDKIYRVVMQAEKDTDHSTVSNVIVKFTPLSASTEYHAHGNMVYIDKNEYLKSALKTAGVNLDLGQTDPELVQQIWDRYEELSQMGYKTNLAPPQITGDLKEDSQVLIDDLKYGTQYIYMMLKQTMTGQYKTLSSVDSLTAILSAAAYAGIFTDEHLFYDDPTTKATMLTAQVGDYIQLTPPTDTLGIELTPDKAWIGSMVKPMLILAAYGVTNLPPYDAFDTALYPPNDPTAPTWFDFINDTVHDQTGEYPTIYCSNADIHNTSYANFTASAIADASTNRHKILINNPGAGYAVIELDTNQYLMPSTRMSWYMNEWRGGGALYPSNLLMIYDWSAFFNYMSTHMGERDFMDLISWTPLVFSNCQYIATKPEGVTYDPDVMTIPGDAMPEDIAPMIPTSYPDWWDDGDEVPQYDPGTDTTPNKPYLPIGINTTTPRTSTPDPISVSLPYIDMIVPHVDIPSVPSIAVSTPVEAGHSNKFFTVYAPTAAQLDTLGGELWDQNVVELLKQTFVSPTDGILGYHQMYLTPTIASADSNIMIGNYQATAQAKKVTSYRAYLDCGTVDVPRFFNDYRDFTETRVLAFLPFIGFQELDPRDVIGCNVKIEYRADVLTGVCVASISPKKGGSANSQVQQCAYMFTGNCAVQVPITAADRSRLLSGALTGAASGAGIGGRAGALFGGAGAGIGAIAGGVIGGALGGIAGYNGGVVVSNGFNANAGALTPYKAPYILIMRNRPADTQYQKVLRGEPANTLVTLKEVKGYTRVKEVYLNIPKATDAEKEMIKGILQSGVIL